MRAKLEQCERPHLQTLLSTIRLQSLGRLHGVSPTACPSLSLSVSVYFNSESERIKCINPIYACHNASFVVVVHLLQNFVAVPAPPPPKLSRETLCVLRPDDSGLGQPATGQSVPEKDFCVNLQIFQKLAAQFKSSAISVKQSAAAFHLAPTRHPAGWLRCFEASSAAR